MQETLPLIKITPMHDPDAEIAGLTLTVPSWVSSIERARNNADMNAASTGAKSRLEEALLSLHQQTQIDGSLYAQLFDDGVGQYEA